MQQKERRSLPNGWVLASYPQHTLTEAWKRFIFHQFHDDLTGTSIPRAYEFSWNDELISLKQFSQCTDFFRQRHCRTDGYTRERNACRSL